MKLLARPGMGWCQGRICGGPVAALTARHCGRELAADDLVAMSKRVIATPVPLGHLAGLEDRRMPTSSAGSPNDVAGRARPATERDID